MCSVDRLRILIFAEVGGFGWGSCVATTRRRKPSARDRDWGGFVEKARGGHPGGPQAEGGAPFTALVSRRRMSVRAGGGFSYRKKAGFSPLSLGWHSVPRVYRRRDRVTGLVRPIGWGGCYDGFSWIRGFLEKG